MTAKVLIFDIGGTVFDWNTAIIETLDRAAPRQNVPRLDRQGFALACRAGFLELNGAITRGEKSWMTADQMLATVMAEQCERAGLTGLSTAPSR